MHKTWCISLKISNTMNTLHYKTTYALLPLILILTVLITPSCGRNRAYEARVKELLLSAERDNFLADVHGGDSIFQSFDTIGPYDQRTYNLRLLLRNRLIPLHDIDCNEVSNATEYFTLHDDSLYIAIAHTMLGDHYMRIKSDRKKAISHIKAAERFCPHGYSCLRTHILFSHAYIYNVEYPERKIELLHKAIGLAERDSNYNYLGHCYCAMMLTHQSDSARIYADKAMNPALLSKMDTLQRLLVMSSFAERFADELSGDSIVALAKPLYDRVSYSYYAYPVGLGYIKLGDTAAAQPCLDKLKSVKDMHLYYHILAYKKAMWENDYPAAIAELTAADSIRIEDFLNLYRENVEELESEIDSTSAIAEIHEKNEWTVIAVLSVALAAVLSLAAIYIHHLRRSRETERQRNRAEMEKMQLLLENREKEERLIRIQEENKALKQRIDTFSGKTVDLIKRYISKERTFSINYITQQINSVTNGVIDRIAALCPRLSTKEILILYLRSIDISNADIALVLEYSNANTVSRTIGKIKDKLPIGDIDIHDWFFTEILPSVIPPDDAA